MKLKLFIVITNLLFFAHIATGQRLSASHMWTSEDNGELSINVSIDTENEEVTINMVGPENDWFAYGFGNSAMDGTYAIILEKQDGSTVLSERILGFHNKGSALPTEFQVVAEEIDGGLRNVTLRGPASSPVGNYDFPSSTGDLSIISATGFGGTLGFHAGNYLQGFQGGINDLSFSQVVPVTWSSFDLDRIDENVSISWETAAEVGNSGFFIQRSMDLNKWEDIGFLKSKDREGSSYQFIDRESLPGVLYYRLRQVDLDGSENFSVVKSIEIGSKRVAEEITLSPNPAKDFIRIENVDQKGWKRIKILNMNYQVVLDEIWKEDQSISEINISDYSPGHYVVMIKHKKWNYVNAFIKL